LSFTHLLAWAIVNAARDMPVMTNSTEERDGKPHRIVPGGVSLRRAVDLEPHARTRPLVLPALRDPAAPGRPTPGYRCAQRRIDPLLQGEDDFYDAVFVQLGLAAAPRSPGPTPLAEDGAGPVTAAEPAPSAVRPEITGVADEALLQAVQAATSVVKAHRMH